MSIALRERQAGVRTNLVLHVQCNEWLIAIDADHVGHVLLCAEASQPEVPPRAEDDLLQEAGDSFLGVLGFGASAFAAWDLNQTLGLEVQAKAWVFLRVPLQGGRGLPVALRTGGCRTVGRLHTGQVSRLPSSMCTRRQKALRAAYIPTPAQLGAASGIAAGLVLDLARLFERKELDLSRRMLQRARRG
jgi:hypothetical protein